MDTQDDNIVSKFDVLLRLSNLQDVPPRVQMCPSVCSLPCDGLNLSPCGQGYGQRDADLIMWKLGPWCSSP